LTIGVLSRQPSPTNRKDNEQLRNVITVKDYYLSSVFQLSSPLSPRTFARRANKQLCS